MSSSMLEKISQVRLLVVGDVMLDRYWFGEVEAWMNTASRKADAWWL